MLTQNQFENSHFNIESIMKDLVDNIHEHVAGLQIKSKLAMTCTYLETHDHLNTRACII